MPSRPVGICKMCLLEKPLARSHLIPARVYRYCRKGKHKPIMIGRGIVLPTDEQVWTHLLCDGCETILNNGGERWTVSKLLTWEKTFPLYDLLTHQKPDSDEDGMQLYGTAKNPLIKADKLTHFALGIFWKASVTLGIGRRPTHRAWPLFEKIRLWLRGEGEGPGAHPGLRRPLSPADGTAKLLPSVQTDGA